MKPNRFLPLFALAVAPWALLACKPQADTTYQGDPLLTLHGTVTLSGPVPSKPIEAALVWYRFIQDGPDGGRNLNTPKNVATAAPVTGAFPAEFTMEVLTLPPEPVFVHCDPTNPSSPRFAQAGIFAINEAADPSNLVHSDFYGVAIGFSVIYAESDLAPGACFMLSDTGWTNPPLTKGYHLIETIPPPPAAILAREMAAYDACEADAGNTGGGTCAAFLPDAGESLALFSTPITITMPVPQPANSFTVAINLGSDVDAGPACLPQPWPINPTTGEPSCQIVVGITSGTCAGAGLGNDLTLQPVGQNFQESVASTGLYLPTICELPQIPSSAWSAGSCAQGPSAGWCYVTGKEAGSCAQAIVLSAATSTTASLPGAHAAIVCPHE